MNRTRYAATAALALVLAGCGAPGSPAMVARSSPEELRDARSEDLCNAIAFYADAPLVDAASARTELERRDALSAAEWETVDRRNIKLGSSKLALVCAWGYPSAVNRSASTAAGAREQWVYRSCRWCGAQYVYVERGRVVSWN